MKQIPRETIDEIRLRNDIAEVIGSYVPLKQAAGRFKALCPFHKEKTPSFTVSPDRQIYHCFGCGAGGDVIQFVQEYEKVDFMTALQMLADRAGMELAAVESGGTGSGNRRELLRIHEEVARLYRQILIDHPDGEAGRAYLVARSIQPQTAEAFGLGFAPDRFDTLVEWARAQKISTELMEKAGLVIPNEQGRRGYDRFRNRLMIPVRDEAGRVIGFSGRAVDPDPKGGKYINSPETPLFHKGRVLFAIDKARRAMAESRTAMMCEGQLDAIRCHEAGFTAMTASQGTALTAHHARMIRRYADEVILVLDADAAGQQAALRSSEVFVAQELSVRIASLPPGEDPDSLIRDQGPEVFRARIHSAVPALDFLIDTVSAQEDLRTETGLLRAVRAVQGLIAQAPGQVQRERMVGSAAARLGISPDALQGELARKAARTRTPDGDEAVSPAGGKPRHPVAEVELLRLLLFHYTDVLPVVADHLPPSLLTDPDCRLIMERLLEDPDGLSSQVAGERQETVRLAAHIQMAERKLRGETDEDVRAAAVQAARDVVLNLWKNELKRRRRQVPPGPESAGLTLQLKQIEMGWEYAAGLMTA